MSNWMKRIVRAGLIVTAADLALMVPFFFINGSVALYLFGAAMTFGVATVLALGVWAALQALDS